MKQIIITIGRQFGSGGHLLAEMIARELNLPLYDKNMIDVDFKYAEKYDEKPVNIFTSRRVKGFSNSNEENLARRQFELIQDLSNQGLSFIVVGRCAEYIFKDNPNALKIFIRGEIEDKIERISKIYNVPKPEAKDLISKTDKKRKIYHNYYCDTKWGDVRNYDLCFNTSKLSLEQCKEIILNIVKEMRDCE
jgi:cytidylate kinase